MTIYVQMINQMKVIIREEYINNTRQEINNINYDWYVRLSIIIFMT